MSNEEKTPNLERLNSVLKYRVTSLDDLWMGDLEEERFNHESLAKFLDLLKEYSLIDLYLDFYYLARECVRLHSNIPFIKEENKLHEKQEIEVLNQLALFYKYESPDFNVQLSHNIFNDSEKITNELLIKEYEKYLIKQFIYYSLFFKKGSEKPSDIKDWRDFFKFYIAHAEPIKTKRGRKSKHIFTGNIIDFLQKYLQKFTNIQADEGVPISNNQSSFIYQFLVIFQVLPDDLGWKNDNIRHTLTKYRNQEKVREVYTDSNKIIKAYLKQQKEKKLTK